MFCCDDFLSLGCYGHCGCVYFDEPIYAPYDGDYAFHYVYPGSAVVRVVKLRNIEQGDRLYFPRELNERQKIYFRIELPEAAPERWLRLAPYECFQIKTAIRIDPHPHCPPPETLPPCEGCDLQLVRLPDAPEGGARFGVYPPEDCAESAERYYWTLLGDAYAQGAATGQTIQLPPLSAGGFYELRITPWKQCATCAFDTYIFDPLADFSAPYY